MLDQSRNFPRVVERIIDHCDYATQLMLRCVCRDLQVDVDRRLRRGVISIRTATRRDVSGQIIPSSERQYWATTRGTAELLLQRVVRPILLPAFHQRGDAAYQVRTVRLARHLILEGVMFTAALRALLAQVQPHTALYMCHPCATLEPAFAPSPGPAGIPRIEFSQTDVFLPRARLLSLKLHPACACDSASAGQRPFTHASRTVVLQFPAGSFDPPDSPPPADRSQPLYRPLVRCHFAKRVLTPDVRTLALIVEASPGRFPAVKEYLAALFGWYNRPVGAIRNVQVDLSPALYVAHRRDFKHFIAEVLILPPQAIVVRQLLAPRNLDNSHMWMLS